MRDKQFNKHRKPFKGKNNNNNKVRRPFSSQNKTDSNFMEKNSINERQVGITEYVTNSVGFTGVLKSRYSDFHVNEIDWNNEILTLNNLEVPEMPNPNNLSIDEINAGKDQFKDLITENVWKNIAELAASSAENDKIIKVDVSSFNKEQRTLLHKIVKTLYSSNKLVSKTTEEEGEAKKFVTIAKQKFQRENRNTWTFPGEYMHFLVHKENMDTSEVVSALATKMRMTPSCINYCGTKDKRAKTTQKFCIKRRAPSQIFGIVKTLRNVTVGNFENSDKVLKLGDLKGNRFRIVLRHLKGNKEDIEYSLQELMKLGFINYYGLQRFGNCASVPTYNVGVALLKNDYKLAVELILKPRESDNDHLREVRETWWKDRDSARAAAKIQGNFIEKKILEGLKKFGESDYANSLRQLPRNTLLLYTHSLQSLIFNRIASRRIEEFGLKLIPGDLVYRDKDEMDADTTAIGNMECDSDENAFKNEESSTVETPEVLSAFKLKVKPLTQEDIDNGNYTLFDVVLPLPGYDITYPDNEVASWYEEYLKEYGLTLASLKHKVKLYSLAGSYRKLLIKPTDMSWSYCGYNSQESVLITSDLEKLKGISESGKLPYTEGDFKALLLDFCLPSSVYATILIRELLKNSTSSSDQTKLEQEALRSCNAGTKRPLDEEGGTSKKQKEDDTTT
ncbi:pseudouridylate synthase 7 homolog [Teleopsis dalmanni]|uniref:pseudouridylate synthase 7 homolog n=1 Tax=Teleopsis dalmanni TaxID=139649 RepID=UPI0018CEA0EC|nr:pseudouridylate synthase 7 homolog [Teleopsis dalmanni]